MSETFGSASFYLRLKTAWSGNDREQMAELLEEHVRRIGGMFLQRSSFHYYSYEDREDALQDAMLYVLRNIDSFLADPRNDPAAGGEAAYLEHEKNGWLRRVVFNGIRHSSQRILRNSHESLDRPVGEQEDGATLENIVSLRSRRMEDEVVCRSQAEEALKSLFSLPNEPATLAVIGYMVMIGELENRKISLEGYAAYFQKTPLRALISQMDILLNRHQLNRNVLAPLRKRTDALPEGAGMPEITARKLANRKNSVLQELRNRRNDP